MAPCRVTDLFRPFGARSWVVDGFPGRCPGLSCCGPFGANVPRRCPGLLWDHSIKRRNTIASHAASGNAKWPEGIQHAEAAKPLDPAHGEKPAWFRFCAFAGDTYRVPRVEPPIAGEPPSRRPRVLAPPRSRRCRQPILTARPVATPCWAGSPARRARICQLKKAGTCATGRCIRCAGLSPPGIAASNGCGVTRTSTRCAGAGTSSS